MNKENQKKIKSATCFFFHFIACASTLFGSKAQRPSPGDDVLQVDSHVYLSEIEKLEASAAINEYIEATVGLTNAATAAVEPTTQSKSSATCELFPHSPKKVSGIKKLQSKVVVVNNSKVASSKTKSPHDSSGINSTQ